LRSFSFCRSAARVGVALGVVVTALATCERTARALDPDRTLSQYLHDRWGSDRGFPGGMVNAITQSRDGYLWIAAEKGLVRFDGLTFRLIQPKTPTAGRDSNVLFLTADQSGAIWAELRDATLVRYRADDFVDLPGELSNLRRLPVAAIATKQDGTVLLAMANQGIVALRGERLETFIAQPALPSSFVITIVETPDGDTWLGTRDSGLLRFHDGKLMRIVNLLPDQKINCLLPVGAHELWIGTDNGIAVWNGREITTASLPASIKRTTALSMIQDADGNVWIVTASGALLRVHGDNVITLTEPDARGHGGVRAVFEDRERDLWIGTTQGIERLRDAAFVSYSSSQGAPGGAVGPVYADSDRIWFAPGDGGLYWVQNQRVGSVKLGGLSDDVVYSISGGAGDIWVARQRGGLTRLRRSGDTFTAESFTAGQGLSQNNVYAVERTRDGGVWAATLSGGVSLLRDRRFTTLTTADGLASNTVSAIAEGRDGTIWFATPSGLSARGNDGWHRYGVAEGLPSNDVNTVFEDSRGNVWIGTTSGLALLRDGRIRVNLKLPDQFRSSIIGITEDKAGFLWIGTTDRLLRIKRDHLAGESAAQDIREFGVADGLPSAEGVKRHRSLIADTGGRIWVATNRGLAHADPARASIRLAPSLVHVEELLADGVAIDRSNSVTIPSKHQRLTLTYAGLSLAAPERVQFRYRLDGFDHEWSAPASARQAVYTNLNPGSYTFRVIASNSEGLWNGQEATQAFSIAPAMWQTMWFRFGGVMLILLASWGIYRFRVMQMSRRLHARFEERLAERTRIAQELHDTLLQGFLSASMQLHVVGDRLPTDSPAKESLAKVQNLITRVIDDGRDAVRGLRSSNQTSRDLAEVFSGVSNEVPAVEDVNYRVIVDGRERPLNPVIRDEVYRIGHEAVINAFRHAEAKNIELQLEYASRGLRLLVRDDGRGIDEAVLQRGREGHWGLSGMRERAGRIGARFSVWSRGGAGTEIELSVPARVAFAREKKP